MSNKQNRERHGMSAVEGTAAVVDQPVANGTVEPVQEATPVAQATANFTLNYRRQHPGGGALGRCSYGVPGVSGIVVFDMSLFQGGVAPATITVDVPLALPKAPVASAKAAEAAAKLAERAAKAQAKIEAAAAKAAEAQAKAESKLAAARAKVAAATAMAAPAAEPATQS